MKNMEESVRIIKQALMMDMQDWTTWYFLGNAYLSNYIVNLKKIDELENALKAYNEAVPTLFMLGIFYLIFNRYPSHLL